MGKQQKPFITELLAEGTKADQNAERNETHRKALMLARKMPGTPAERLVYVRNLTTQAIAGKLDKEVFKEVIRLTNSWYELESCAARASLLAARIRGAS